MQKVYVTGMGAVSALGLNCSQTLDALREQRCGIGPLRYLQTIHDNLPCGQVPASDAQLRDLLHIPPSQITTRTTLMGILALKEALDQAFLTQDKALAKSLFCGTTVGGMEKSEQYYRDFLTNDSHNEYISTHDCGACTQMMADAFQGFTFISTLSTACSSAANSLILAANRIICGMDDIAVAGGSECLTRFHLNGFNTLRILDSDLCRPFDASRKGLNLGEGAAFLVLESERSVRQRGVTPLCLFSGYGNACDAFHQTASSPDGEGAYLAMKKALAMSSLEPHQVDYVNAHGTGTLNNDESEGHALMRIFGSDGVPPVSSTKSFTGHTTSASGALESVISILALKHQFLPINLRFNQRIEGLSFDPVTTSSPNRELTHVLCNSFGFGGNDTSLVFSKL